MKNNTAEDLIEIISGMTQGKFVFEIQNTDRNLMFSLGKQCLRQIPFSDRQYELAKRKILDYKDQFEANGIDGVEEKMNNLRQPLRSIDRSKTISLVEQNDQAMIAVRFPFAKNMIKYIEILNSIHKNKGYDKANKTHYVDLTEKNIYRLIGNFQKANFEIEDSLKEQYRKLLEMKENKNKYVPGVYGLKLKNLHNRAFDYAVSSIGEPSLDNLALYKDRQEILGINYFDEDDLQQSIHKLQPLTKKIINRNKQHILINSTKYSIDNIVETVLELHRFPLLVIIPDNDDSAECLQNVYECFKGIVLDESCTVMFRKDNKNEIDRNFNTFIKQKNLNNSLAKDSKIVYINNNKIPKPLLVSDWKPSAVLMYGSRRTNMKLDSYVGECDLVIHYDSDSTPFRYQDIEEV
jgi:hypothetical protein